MSNPVHTTHTGRWFLDADQKQMTRSRDNFATGKLLLARENNAHAAAAKGQAERPFSEPDKIGLSHGVVGVILPKALIEDGWVQVCPPNIKLFGQGSTANDIFLIERGFVKLTHVEKNGREIIVDLCFPGWLLGAAPVILKELHAVSAITLTDCYLRRISAPAFLELIESDQSVSWYVHQMHSRELLDKIGNIAQLGCLTARERLMHLLRRLIAEPTKKESPFTVKIHLPLKHWELAQLIAITPEHLSRLLKRMEQRGILRQEKDWLFLRDRLTNQ